MKTWLWCLLTFKWHPECEETQKALHVVVFLFLPMQPPKPHGNGVTEIYREDDNKQKTCFSRCGFKLKLCEVKSMLLSAALFGLCVG